MKWIRTTMALGLTSCLVAAAVLTADELPAKQPASAWQAYFRRLAGEYRLTAGESSTELRLVSAPVLKWSQPVRGGQDGAVYLWLQGGRPTVVGTFFIWPNGEQNFGVSHELHALTTDKVLGDWRNNIRWRPSETALNWHEVPNVAAADPLAAKRSIEARQIARRFAGKSTDRNGQTSQLRLQPRAFFEYESSAASNDWLGGALFSLAHGTDTEVIVWLEAARDRDRTTWKHACVRMSDLALAVTLDGKEVWTTELAEYNQFEGPYLCTAPEFLEAPPAEKP